MKAAAVTASPTSCPVERASGTRRILGGRKQAALLPPPECSSAPVHNSCENEDRAEHDQEEEGDRAGGGKERRCASRCTLDRAGASTLRRSDRLLGRERERHPREARLAQRSPVRVRRA